jgi:hypothetical protein
MKQVPVVLPSCYKPGDNSWMTDVRFVLAGHIVNNYFWDFKEVWYRWFWLVIFSIITFEVWKGSCTDGFNGWLYCWPLYSLSLDNLICSYHFLKL